MCALLARHTGTSHLAQPAHVGHPAPDFTLADSTGVAIKLSAYKGRVVLLDFWGTYCELCKVEIPWYIEFENRYKQSGL
jgi:peroxiredoxin